MGETMEGLGIARVAGMIGDPSRAAMLEALIERAGNATRRAGQTRASLDLEGEGGH
ncbi:MAG: hypothetical protein ACREK1_14150 [Longimicrobiales bacterium]